tara:strand:+ start:936 stop:1166 length:231 start_codon:yes stop_codon:yes gene_type:complete
MFGALIGPLVGPLFIIFIIVLIYYSFQSGERDIKAKVVEGAGETGSFFRETYDAFTTGVTKDVYKAEKRRRKKKIR